MKFYDNFFTKQQKYGKLCSPVVVDVETVLVPCLLIVDNMFYPAGTDLGWAGP